MRAPKTVVVSQCMRQVLRQELRVVLVPAHAHTMASSQVLRQEMHGCGPGIRTGTCACVHGGGTDSRERMCTLCACMYTLAVCMALGWVIGQVYGWCYLCMHASRQLM